jgi:hypothetical protein
MSIEDAHGLLRSETDTRQLSTPVRLSAKKRPRTHEGEITHCNCLNLKVGTSHFAWHMGCYQLWLAMASEGQRIPIWSIQIGDTPHLGKVGELFSTLREDQLFIGRDSQ